MPSQRGFRLLFPERDIPTWAARYSYAGSDDDLLDRVAWPTASTILHFCDARPYPILDYRALWSLGYAKPPKYTMEFWLEYLEFTRELAGRLGLPIRTVDKALWQYSKEKQG